VAIEDESGSQVVALDEKRSMTRPKR